MSMISIAKRARELYTSAPSHAPSGTFPEAGTYCLVTAIDKAASDVRDARNARTWTPHAFTWIDHDNLHAALAEIAYPGYRQVRANARGNLITYNAEHDTVDVLALFDTLIQRDYLANLPITT